MSREICEASLKPLILQHPLDGSILATGGQLGLEDDAKRPIANNLALSVCELSSLSGQAVLNLFANDFWKVCQQRSQTAQPIRSSHRPFSNSRMQHSYLWPCFGCVFGKRHSAGASCYREYGGLRFSSWCGKREAPRMGSVFGNVAARAGGDDERSGQATRWSSRDDCC